MSLYPETWGFCTYSSLDGGLVVSRVKQSREAKFISEYPEKEKQRHAYLSQLTRMAETILQNLHKQLSVIKKLYNKKA